MLNDNLNPCPFCGCKAIFRNLNATDPKFELYSGVIMCTECTASLNFQYMKPEYIIQAWNRRWHEDA